MCIKYFIWFSHTNLSILYIRNTVIIYFLFRCIQFIWFNTYWIYFIDKGIFLFSIRNIIIRIWMFVIFLKILIIFINLIFLFKRSVFTCWNTNYIFWLIYLWIFLFINIIIVIKLPFNVFILGIILKCIRFNRWIWLFRIFPNWIRKYLFIE